MNGKKPATRALTIIIGGEESGEEMQSHGKEMGNQKRMSSTCPKCGHEMDDMDEMEEYSEDASVNKTMMPAKKKTSPKMLGMLALKNMMKHG